MTKDIKLKENDIIEWPVICKHHNNFDTIFIEKGKIFKIKDKLMVSARGCPDEPVWELGDHILEKIISINGKRIK